jgi:beta-glucosidase/6-phospho-beta-glucosidase/beta-galactosidase
MQATLFSDAQLRGNSCFHNNKHGKKKDFTIKSSKEVFPLLLTVDIIGYNYAQKCHLKLHSE